MDMAAKILVVDDEPGFERLVLQRFRRQVRGGEFEFVFALGGHEALETLGKRQDIDIALCDINMPKMSGLALIAKLRESHPLLKIVMVSAYGDLKNIRAAMNLGAYDFVTKPIDFDDLETTIRKTLNETAVTRRAERAKELEEKNEQLKELDELKSRFFTNISHELRTPLTVISGMAGQVKENPEKWFSKGLQMIQRNSDNLLVLVNQILELQKLESGKMALKAVRGDVIHYMRYIAESFQSFAESKQIQLQFRCAEKDLVMDYDPEKLLSIVSNLLSNAVKYTPEGGRIDFLIEKRPTSDDSSNPEVLQIQVKDTGIGIPADQLPFIFDRFFQADTPDHPRRTDSTGIGLALTRELVKLMDGDIRVDSSPEGSAFYVRLPITRNAGDPDVQPDKNWIAQLADFIPGGAETPETLSFDGATGENAPALLLVEDNPDVLQYLVSCLGGEYRISVARDGQEGIDKALEEIPDIIISDVMMPGKDGLELCRTLKTDQNTSHIPIILLTAKADIESRIAGLERGADDYLAKPFDKTELLVRLNRLLELRRQLQARYRSFAPLKAEAGEPVFPEDSFIIRIRSAVEANLDDEFFATPQLCQAIGMSRSQLHKKIKALTGRSTTHFMRSIRLHKALELLENSDLNISQVAYEVGFRDPKYFSKTFAEEFGKKPNEVRRG